MSAIVIPAFLLRTPSILWPDAQVHALKVVALILEYDAAISIKVSGRKFAQIPIPISIDMIVGAFHRNFVKLRQCFPSFLHGSPSAFRISPLSIREAGDHRNRIAPLLKQSKCITRPPYGVALFLSQIHELKSVAVAAAVADDP